MPELTPVAWAVLALGAFGVGFSKTAIGGLASVCVALYAAVLPAKASTGTLLVLLLVGDVVAVSVYRHDVAWRALGRLVAPVLAGVGVGAVFLARVSDSTLKTTIGIVLLALVALHYARGVGSGRRGESGRRGRSGRRGGLALALGYGSLAGFTTMVANAGGAAMTLYFLNARFGMMRFLGTGAWFFFLVNTLKLPFSVGLGLIDSGSLATCAPLVPLVLAGAWAGRIVIKRTNQARFNTLVLAFTAVS
ncbi:MAG: sulfite exporter TauE/SafE family protein, partial [Bifidobacteriaceae bacterium]|nr:sulfite exporter TauE/SafE family protein [Bifidobacteriaceae bacterium]